MGIRDQLHPIQRGNRVILSAALKVSDGYASNISRCVQVNERKIFGWKSHDCHVLMQQLFPLAIRGVLHKNVCVVIVELCSFFRQLCSKVLKTNQLEHLENDIIVTLCKLERIFFPSLFDVMVHLPIHLASEAKVAWTRQYRWMYPIERYLRTLKSYVRNKSRPEGSIAEGYIAEECTTFCSRYLHDVETKHDREERNYVIENNITNGGGLTIFKCMGQWSQAHLYVLTNCEEVTSFIEEHKQSIRVKPRIRARDVDLIHTREFISWFEERIIQMRHEGPISEHILSLSRGPSTSVTCYKGYIINGFRFHTREREKGKKLKIVELLTQFWSYFLLWCANDVIELHYLGGNRVILFKWNKKNEYGFTCLNFERTICIDEPFVLASQAKQVFYVQNSNEENWHTVVEIQTRGVYDMNKKVSTNDPEPYQQFITPHSQRDVHELAENDLINWDRNDIAGETIQTDVLLSRQENIVERHNEFIQDDV
ncbi:hypothetical protein AAG906_022144 [Vitis piasezkii]